MEEAKQQLVQNWLIKAQHDLATARKLSVGPDPYLDTAIYHCQQAAEKAVKAFLVFRDQRFEKVHDVRLLIEIAAMLESSLLPWLDTGERLTPYATAFRYPGEILDRIRMSLMRRLQTRKSSTYSFFRYCLLKFTPDYFYKKTSRRFSNLREVFCYASVNSPSTTSPSSRRPGPGPVEPPFVPV
ncbi:MAG: HEPN domain-containing protein [Chloroflexi bacterium]|nr:HEPN domain-containing protein [Chloroflexota bacterium]